MWRVARLSPPAVLLVFLVVLPMVHRIAPMARLVDSPWSLLGLVLVAAGIGLNVVADGLFKRFGADSARCGPDALVTAGPYRVSRNPMYLGFGLVLLGLAVALSSVGALLAALSFIPVAEWLFVRGEEALLRERHGQQWADYAARVRRWV